MILLGGVFTPLWAQKYRYTCGSSAQVLLLHVFVEAQPKQSTYYGTTRLEVPEQECWVCYSQYTPQNNSLGYNSSRGIWTGVLGFLDSCVLLLLVCFLIIPMACLLLLAFHFGKFQKRRHSVLKLVFLNLLGWVHLEFQSAPIVLIYYFAMQIVSLDQIATGYLISECICVCFCGKL